MHGSKFGDLVEWAAAGGDQNDSATLPSRVPIRGWGNFELDWYLAREQCANMTRAEKERDLSRISSFTRGGERRRLLLPMRKTERPAGCSTMTRGAPSQKICSRSVKSGYYKSHFIYMQISARIRTPLLTGCCFHGILLIYRVMFVFMLSRRWSISVMPWIHLSWSCLLLHSNSTTLSSVLTPK